MPLLLFKGQLGQLGQDGSVVWLVWCMAIGPTYFLKFVSFAKRGRGPNLALMVLMRMGEWGRMMTFVRCRPWCGNVTAFSFPRVRARYIRYAFVGETW